MGDIENVLQIIPQLVVLQPEFQAEIIHRPVFSST